MKGEEFERLIRKEAALLDCGFIQAFDAVSKKLDIMPSRKGTMLRSVILHDSVVTVSPSRISVIFVG